MAFQNHNMNLVQKLGILVFVFFAGIPALEESGFGFGMKLGLPLYLVIATLGGGLGGAMLAPRKHWAGLIGGLVAGPCGLLAVYYYA